MSGRSRRLGWAGVLLAAALALWAYGHFDLGQQLTLESLKGSRDSLQALVQQSPGRAIAIFFAVYVLVTALSLPGATVLTLAAGALFGLWPGLLLASFASSIGATLAFLTARYLLRDAVQQRLGERLAPINEGMRRDGAWYLLTLRLVPVFPFFIINLVMGLTPISTPRFYVVSQLGMLAGTLVFVNAGTQLAQLQRLSDVLSPSLLASFAVLGLFPWLARALVAAAQALRTLAAAARLRPQPGGAGRGLGRAGHGLHRRGRQGRGHARRTAPDGW
jgi:uncharacterized membrane protein YdjX (TVP38/TMEM64 family)